MATAPDWIEQCRWHGAAFKIGLDSESYLADGTTTLVPPPDWPNPHRRSR